MDYSFLIKSFIALFVIIDPVGGAPFFLSITAGYTREERKRIAFKACITAFIVLSLFLFIGKNIFSLFQISVSSFKIAGGILLFLTGIEMLFGKIRQAKASQEEAVKGIKKDDVSIVPLGIPYLAGPGAITTVIIFSQQADFIGKIFIWLNLFIICALTYFTFCKAEKIFNLLGELGTKALIRILGLLLTTIAVEYIVHGIKESFF